MNREKIDWLITTVLQWTLNLVLLALAAVLCVALIKETYQFFTYLFLSENASYYHLLEGILVFFLYFEFIALIIKYFQAHYHFPLRYFIYIGVTAIVRLIIVSHDHPHSVLLYAIAILVLVGALYIANTKMLRRE
ncbi:MAG: phosphate-starvation-inducible protein PsiE [Sporolactobacillus sp.]|uniref:phosphate-starvation-inducible protein PsiE n=1 Tax=Sporolactobacillus sp. STSJ-5 TaxID=2965076 RepID=UPI00210216C2|nr:phosphate-starvation-inducible protein PsiE [Sporolactobacillus sp. STSJ-5]MCQ2010827.1 phosphate-starvation-inducible protein PsiE [Sporolactobacillus sp. STSJ-5]